LVGFIIGIISYDILIIKSNVIITCHNAYIITIKSKN